MVLTRAVLDVALLGAVSALVIAYTCPAPVMYMGQHTFLVVPYIGYTHVSVAAPLLAGAGCTTLATAAWVAYARWVDRCVCAGCLVAVAIFSMYGPLHNSFQGLPAELRSLVRIAEALVDNEYVDHGRLEAEWHKSSKVHCERRAAIQNGSLTLPAGVGDTWRFFGPPTVLEGVFSEAEAAGISDAVLSMHDLMTFDHRAFPLPEFRLGGYYASLDCTSSLGSNSKGVDEHACRHIYELNLAINTKILAKLGHFNIYDRIAARLSKELGGSRVVWDVRSGLPTFQLQYTHRVSTLPVFKRHCDGVASLHPLQRNGVAAAANASDDLSAGRSGGGDEEEVCSESAGMISMVIPFKVAPEAGLDWRVIDPGPIENATRAGCDAHPCHARPFVGARTPAPETPLERMWTMHRKTDGDFERCTAAAGKTEYLPGNMHVYTGPVLHAVAPWPYTTATDARLVIVAFAFFCNGAWVITSNPTILETDAEYGELLRREGFGAGIAGGSSGVD